MFTEKWLGHNFALHITSYLSIALSQILPHSKPIKNAKKLLVFCENGSHHLSNFLQSHIFWKFDHISRTYNQINYRNIWFAKVAIILLMIAQVLSFDIFFEKDPHLHAVEYTFFSKEVETPRCSFKWISRVWARIFCKPASNYNLVKKSPIAIFFCLFHSLPMLCVSMGISGKPIIVKLTSESLKIWYIFEVQWFTILLQCVSVTDFISRNLFESPTNYIWPKVYITSRW